MDFLNQAIGQVRDLFLSMTPAARVTAVLLLGVIGISLTFLFQQHTTGPDDYLFGGEYLTSREVDAAMAAIATAGLYDAEQVGNRIRVPHGQQEIYLAAISKAGALPVNFDEIMEKVLDLGPFVDSETRRQRIKNGTERRIGLILRGWDSIEDAKVMYDITPPKGLSRQQQATASVSVRPASGETLDPRQIKMIRKMVAGAISGLTPDHVQVANQITGLPYGGDGTLTGEMFDNPYYQTRINYEHLMEDKISRFLNFIPGVQVMVTAELDDTVSRTTVSEKPDGEGVTKSESGSDDEITSTQSQIAGRPGLQAQGPQRAGEQTEQEKILNKTVSSTSQTDNVVGMIQEKTEWAGFVPKQVQAAIAVPSIYLIDVYHQRHPDEAEDARPDESMLGNLEIKLEDQIKNLITPLLPRQLEKNPYPAVEITIFESLPPEPMVGPSTASQAMAWANQNIGNMMMGGLTLFSLVMLRSMVKSIPPSDPVADIGPSSLPFPQSGDNESAASDDSTATSEDGSRPRLQLNKGPTLKDDLSDIVREDTEAAASILRTWISNAG